MYTFNQQQKRRLWEGEHKENASIMVRAWSPNYLPWGFFCLLHNIQIIWIWTVFGKIPRKFQFPQRESQETLTTSSLGIQHSSTQPSNTRFQARQATSSTTFSRHKGTNLPWGIGGHLAFSGANDEHILGSVGLQIDVVGFWYNKIARKVGSFSLLGGSSHWM